jgi:BASS family bile acid:Na+ symporter
MLNILTNLFPLWVLAGALLALWQPTLFTWFSGPLIPAGLGVIMLGMGLTLTVDDFRRIVKMPGRIFTGALLQYTIMPFLGWSMAALFRLPPPLAAGVILVACCPGGTASNVVTYLAKADVPLSVTMTTLTTLMAVVMTPALTTWLVGSRVEVSFWGLLRDTIQVVVLPVVLGVSLNRFFSKVTQRILPIAPLMAVVFITLIVSSIVGMGREHILKSGLALIAAVAGLHAGGFFLGYVVALIVTKDQIAARTISIEVGMQNSGLGVVLARSNFASPLVAIPCAISSVFHSLIGSLLAAVWRRQPVDKAKQS